MMVKSTQIFKAKKSPRNKSLFYCAAAVVPDSVCRTKNEDYKYYQQIHLEE